MVSMRNDDLLLLVARDVHVHLVVLEYDVVALRGVGRHNALGILQLRECQGLVIVEHALSGSRDRGTSADGAVAVQDQVSPRFQRTLRTTKSCHNMEVMERLVDLGEDLNAGVGKDDKLVRRRDVALALAKSVNKVSTAHRSANCNGTYSLKLW